MILRILMTKVVPERLQDWLHYGRTIGFPGMLAQPGCRGIFRLRVHKAEFDFGVMTLWDDIESFERFRTSPAMSELSAKAGGLTIRPYTELLFDVMPDDSGNEADIAGALAKAPR